MRRQNPDSALKGQGIYLSLLLLSAAVFLFEITLTRLFAIAHFYHFAFMVVSLALLGMGASGSFLSLFPILASDNSRRRFSFLCACCGFSILGAYLLFNRLPFDAYAIAIDPRQIAVFLLQLLALSSPFFSTGLCVNGLMNAFPDDSSRIYAVNLAGSALGCLLAPFLLPFLGGEGVALFCVAFSALSSILPLFISFIKVKKWDFPGDPKVIISLLLCMGLLLSVIPELVHRTRGDDGHPLFDLYRSPYKALSYALQYPGATLVDSQWNAFSRVDVVHSGGIRSLPGLSYLYPGLISADAGLFVDGDNLSPVLPLDVDADYFSYLPGSLAYQLRPSAAALVLDPRGGLDLLTAHAGNAASVTAVEPNPLLVHESGGVYTLSDTSLSIESPRSFLRQGKDRYDVIVFSLASSYHPVTSGAYSLGENYIYTFESVQDALARLEPDGLLVLSRWLQLPPSEFLRAFILTVEALEKAELDPRLHIAALRGYNLGTLFVKRTPFNADEATKVRTFAENRAFDLVYLPGIQPGENNRFNILPEDDYYASFTGYMNAPDRRAWLDAYPYDVSAPTDNKPFFGHFFKWSQVRQVIASYGTTWQPFGGAGYLVVVFILFAVLIFSTLLILLPVLIQHLRIGAGDRTQSNSLLQKHALAYFLLLGMGFMAIEIPLIQKFILFLGQPAYSFSAVLFTILLASGFGSLVSPHIKNVWLLVLGLAACLSPLWLSLLTRFAVGWSLPFRFLMVLVCLAPLGFLMGLPFPKGITAVQEKNPRMVPWLWAVNGAASVVSTVLSAMLAISFGFIPLLIGGGVCYLLAYTILKKL